MPRGTLEVILISAKGLQKNSDFFTNIDPYVILTYRSQEHKSTVKEVAGAGSNPQWNENFLFTISDNFSDLYLRIMDKDAFTEDDFLGEAKIPLEPVLYEGCLPETDYNVVRDQEYCGEIKVALIFTPQRGIDKNYGEAESCGGWNESIRDY